LRLSEQTSIPDIRRVAVSDHNLLGGDNIDLAIAHFLESRFAGAAAGFPARNGTSSSPPAGT
jgi:hypothetical protein